MTSHISAGPENRPRKSGIVEFYRFVFCITVLLFHGYNHLLTRPNVNHTGLHFSLAPQGALGVEFFFLLSGYLMARHVWRKASSGASSDLGQETALFVFSKWKSIFPCHLLVFPFAVFAFLFHRGYHIADVILYVIKSIPSLFFIQKLGFFDSNVPNGPEWYLSVMLFSLLLLYPMCRHNYSMFVHVFAPAAGLAILGWISYTSSSLTDITAWTGWTFKCMLRGFAELSLGAVCFEITRQLNHRRLSQRTRYFMGALELLLLAGISGSMFLTYSDEYQIFCLFALIPLVILMFCDLPHHELFRGRFFSFLGKLSLPIYLIQVPVANYILTFSQLSETQSVCLYVALSLIGALLLLPLSDCLSARMFERKHA